MSRIILISFWIITELFASDAIGQGWQVQYDIQFGTFSDLHFINEDTGWAVGYSSTGILLKTTNKGKEWIALPAPQNYGTGIYFTDNLNGWISHASGFLTRTTNGGFNWIISDCNSCDNSDDFIDIQFIDQYTGWAYGDLGIFKSTDGGVNYFEQPNRYFVHTGMFLNALTGFTVISNSFSKSIDGGNSWKRSGIPGMSGWGDCLFFINEMKGWVASRIGEIFKTENSGLNWTQQSVNNPNRFYKILFTNENTGWVIGDSGKIFKTANGGSNWNRQTSPLDSRELNGIFMLNSQEGWICGQRYILYTNDGGGPVGINNISQIEPYDYKLHQNYPNPFNPSTIIKFDVKGQTSNVKLVIYDALGKEVNTLVNDELQSGSYEVNFNGANLPSGVYFYKLAIGNFSDTKKMFLVK